MQFWSHKLSIWGKTTSFMLFIPVMDVLLRFACRLEMLWVRANFHSNLGRLFTLLERRSTPEASRIRYRRFVFTSKTSQIPPGPSTGTV